MQFSDLELLVGLINYGKVSMQRLNDNKSDQMLKHQFSNVQFDHFLKNMQNKAKTQEDNFLSLIKMFNFLQLINETEYSNLHAKFLSLLPETRLNLLKIIPISFQSLCEISKVLRHETNNNRIILKLKQQRANIYRQNKLYYLEQLELIDLLNAQQKGPESNPVIYYRLACLNEFRGDWQQAARYTNLAQKKYYEKSDKKIFRKIAALTAKFNETGTFFDGNKMVLFQIFNIIDKLKRLDPDFNSTDPSNLSAYGFEWFEGTCLLDCLFYHLIDSNQNVTSIEQYLNENTNSLTLKHNELVQFKDSDLLKNFNDKFKTNISVISIFSSSKKSINANESPVLITHN
jgi:hypothetical protein